MKHFRFAAVLAAIMTISLPALAEEHPESIHIHDAYGRAMGGVGASGAVFLMMHNNTAEDDRLIAAKSDVAQKVELHTHKEDANGVMQMIHVEEGFALPAGEMHELARGGDHVMLMGLTRELAQGDTFPLTLVFEKAGEVVVDVTIDNDRKPGGGMEGHDHSGHDHSGHDQSGDATPGTGHGHAGHDHAATAPDTTGMTDPDAITAIMKAKFDTPENPLTVAPVVVEGDHALATWVQGDQGGRALLERRDGAWVIVLCGGEDLRMSAFLGEHGVTGAEKLSRMFNQAEDGLGEDLVSKASSFEGIVMVAGQGH